MATLAGRVFLMPVGPQGRPWMWASGHNGDIKRAAYGYEATRAAAMAAFAKSWRRLKVAGALAPPIGGRRWSARPDLPQIVAVKRPTTNMTTEVDDHHFSSLVHV